MSHFIIYDVEDAWVEYLKTRTPIPAIASSRIYRGIWNEASSEDQNTLETGGLSRIECVCQEAEPATEEAKAWLATGQIRVRANADSTLASDFRDIVRAVLNEVNTTTIAADLSAAINDFTCLQILFGTQSYEVLDRSWVAVQNFQMHCTGKAGV